MKPIEFPGTNIVFGKHQPEYNHLPAILLQDGTVITCWELTDEEIDKLKETKKLYLKQLTFNNSLQPIAPMVELDNDINFTYE